MRLGALMVEIIMQRVRGRDEMRIAPEVVVEEDR